MMRAKIKTNDVLKRMFPHSFKLTITYSTGEESDSDDPFADTEETTETVVEEYPCSVQHETTSENKSIGGYVLSDHYVLMCPKITFKESLPIAQSKANLTLYLNIRGNKYQVDGNEILSIDTMEVFEIGGYKIGTKITFKLSDNLFI